MATQFKCIDKFRDRQGNIIGYRLQSSSGSIFDVDSDTLKYKIKSGQSEVINLTLTSDNRLISTQPNNKEDNKIDIARIKQQNKDNKLYVRYQRIFDTMGIDVLAAVYMSLPKEGDTVEDILQRSFCISREFKADILYNLNMLIGNIDEFLGSSNQIYKVSEHSFGGRESSIRIPILLLHKNGELKLVAAGELSYVYIATQDIMEQINKEAKKSLAVFTLNGSSQPVVTKVGTNINDKEASLLASRIIESDLRNWVGKESTKNVLNSMNKVDAKIKLQAAGVSTLAMPFSVAMLVGAVGGCVVEAFTEPWDNKKFKEGAEAITAMQLGPVGIAALKAKQKNNNQKK